MRYDACQFGSFDGLDNRREIMILLQRLGDGESQAVADQIRASFLESLIPHSVSRLAAAPLQVKPCDPVESYIMFVAITGCLDVPVEEAAKLLEAAVRAKGSLAGV